MSETSARLSLPYLMPSQAQKHVTHNEAVRQLDILVQANVQSRVETHPTRQPGRWADLDRGHWGHGRMGRP